MDFIELARSRYSCKKLRLMRSRRADTVRRPCSSWPSTRTTCLHTLARNFCRNIVLEGRCGRTYVYPETLTLKEMQALFPDAIFEIPTDL